MGKFMDVHSGFHGVTAQQLAEAHQRDLAIEGDEGVHFERAWLDPDAGKVVNMPIYWRFDMKPGARINGPAIIAENETSTLVGSNFRGSVDSLGYIVLDRVKGSR